MYIISILLVKLINFLIKLLGIGSGRTWPGHIVLKLDPFLLKKIQKRLPEKVIIISGTNGKTTTTKLTSHLLMKTGNRVLYNKTGGNLINGIVTTVLLNSSLNGKLNYDCIVFELDEAALPKVIEVIEPDVIALLNLSRDQLDRHWEVDLIYDRWFEAIKKLTKNTTLVLDQEESRFQAFEALSGHKIKYFDANPKSLQHTKLVGSFNAKNVNCALQIVRTFGLDAPDLISHLKTFQVAYGRGEIISLGEKSLQIFLAKNPASLNLNLKMLIEGDLEYDTLLYVLNDNVPDGHDVSWIFDINPDLLKKASEKKNIFISGTRAYDMAIRLQYAEVSFSEENVYPELKTALKKLKDCQNCRMVVALPNYSAMLETRKLVTGKKIL